MTSTTPDNAEAWALLKNAYEHAKAVADTYYSEVYEPAVDGVCTGCKACETRWRPLEDEWTRLVRVKDNWLNAMLMVSAPDVAAAAYKMRVLEDEDFRENTDAYDVLLADLNRLAGEA